jgi:hypothetical protein
MQLQSNKGYIRTERKSGTGKIAKFTQIRRMDINAEREKTQTAQKDMKAEHTVSAATTTEAQAVE